MGKKKLVTVSGHNNECCVCFNRITGKAGKLPCGHDNLCVDCIIKVFTTMDVKCPICRWVPIKKETPEQRSASVEEWTMIATGRLFLKSDKGRDIQKVKRIAKTLEIFDVEVDTKRIKDVHYVQAMCRELAIQLHYETDDENGPDDDEDGSDEE
jgi:hypothetical protein